MITIESLIHETIEQEMRELIIGLALLQKSNDEDEDAMMTIEILKTRAESFLNQHFNISTVQFDIHDCVHKLSDLNLLEDESDGSLKAVSLEVARDRIKSRIRSEFTMH